MAAPEDERGEELGSLEAIFPELIGSPDHFTADLELAVTPTHPLLLRFMPSPADTGSKGTYATVVMNGAACIEQDVKLSHLPPLCMHVTLPLDYPSHSPPNVLLTTKHDWLPEEKLRELEHEAEKLWEEYGHCQILFAYIDFLHSAAERGFDLDQSVDGCLVLPMAFEHRLVSFDAETKLSVFNTGTYDCGICLEPKKGSACYRMERCGHVFCRQCLQDFYNNAITEGDVVGIKCLDPICGKKPGQTRKRKVERTLHPRELLAMGIEAGMVRRYVEMKRKKKLEADKSTVYCPRTWCQGPAKSPKYPPIPVDLAAYISTDSPSDAESDTETTPPQHDSPRTGTLPDPSDRLAICEACNLAFCRVCYMGWHGPFARCYPRDPSELSAEEKASYDYIRLHTSPCCYCNSPIQKTHGCNHMQCFQCNTHFCYLCGAWLDAGNPYLHYNKAGTGCYQRLWELEEGDDGQAPEDGRGFAGGRGWEQIALEAAREADAREAENEAAAREAQAEEDAAAGQALMAQWIEPPVPEVVIAMAAIHLDDPAAAVVEGPEVRAQQRAPRGGRRPRNPFPMHPPAQAGGGVAQIVRNHERGAAVGQRGRGTAPRVNVARGRRRVDAEVEEEEEVRRGLEGDLDDLGGGEEGEGAQEGLGLR